MKAIKVVKNNEIKELSVDDDFYDFIASYLCTYHIHIFSEEFLEHLVNEFLLSKRELIL